MRATATGLADTPATSAGRGSLTPLPTGVSELVSWAWYDVRTMSPDGPTDFFSEAPRPRLSNYWAPGQLVSPVQEVDLRTIQLCHADLSRLIASNGGAPPVGNMALIIGNKSRWEGPTLLSWNCPQPMVQDDDALILSGPEQSRPGLCLRVEPDGDTRVLMAVLVGYKRRPLQ